MRVAQLSNINLGLVHGLIPLGPLPHYPIKTLREEDYENNEAEGENNEIL